MKQNWVQCPIVNGKTFSETIGYWTFVCSDWECSEEIKSAIEKSFNTFMAEKGKEYAPHYNAIINPDFTAIWLGLTFSSVWENRHKFYLTNHYCTTNILEDDR
jgi:hypothetical protein